LGIASYCEPKVQVSRSVHSETAAWIKEGTWQQLHFFLISIVDCSNCYALSSAFLAKFCSYLYVERLLF
jgi:hypothetical protein